MGFRRLLTRTGLVAAALLLATPAAPALAQTPEAGPVLVSETGYAGTFRPGHRTVVRVKVQPTRLVDGRVTVHGPLGRVSRNVEVAGGSVKEFVFVVPTPPHNSSLEIQVELRQGGTTHRHRSAASGDGQEEVVGLLPGAVGSGALPAAAPLAVDMGTVRFARVTPAELAFAPASLDGLTLLAAGQGELASLGRDTAAAIAGWVGKGGRLYVDEAPGAAVPGFPDRPDLATGPQGRVAVGAGEVVALNGAIGAGRWAGVVEPSSLVTSEDMGMMGSVAETVAREANVRQAGLGGLIGFLVLYVAVVGPVLFLVLSRMGRRELAWVGIPAIAVLFTIGAYVMGRDLRSGARPAHATALVMHGDQAEARTWVGLVSERGGTPKVTFPRQWTVAEHDGVFRRNDNLIEALERADGVQAGIPLGAGEFGMLTGTGPVAPGGRLDVTGTVDREGNATGTVVNNLPFALERVAVSVGDNATVINRLNPGEKQDWAVRATRVFGRELHPALNALRQGGINRFDEWRGGDGPVLLGAMDMADLAAGNNRLTAVGVARDYQPPVRAGRGLVGTTLVASIGTLALPSDGAPGELTTAFTPLRGRAVGGMGGMAGMGGMIGPGAGGIYLRLDALNPAIDPNKAKLHVHGVSSDMDVWLGGKWVALNLPAEALEGRGGRGFAPGRMPVPIPPPDMQCPPGADCGFSVETVPIGPGGHAPGDENENDPTMVPLPPGAIVNGRLYLRVNNPHEPVRGHELEVLPA